MQNITDILNQFEAISLEKLLNAELMNRVDTKFLIPHADLSQVLHSLNKDYYVLEVNGQRMAKYENLYFDMPDHNFYLDHHNGKDHRFKVRFRKYENSQTTFFEIKEHKKKRTNKERFQVDQMSDELKGPELALVQKMLGISNKLHPKLKNHYQRITLVNETLKERFTLDLNLVFENDDTSRALQNVIVAELKQQGLNRKSPVFEVMNQKKIRPFRISKYCIGTVLLFPKERVKYNRFKHIIQKLNTFNNAI
ncbi:MAG TPA: polyphosphate polymerase domain-containing protein [Brumimicrobium sp.]|nr:polyphosphate polymerase domain-containing protein [Brumimicrobium sp.]